MEFLEYPHTSDTAYILSLHLSHDKCVISILLYLTDHSSMVKGGKMFCVTESEEAVLLL